MDWISRTLDEHQTPEHRKSKTSPAHPHLTCGIEQNKKSFFWIRIGGGGVVGGPSPSSTFQLMSKLCRSFSIFDNYLLALFRQQARPTAYIPI